MNIIFGWIRNLFAGQLQCSVFSEQKAKEAVHLQSEIESFRNNVNGRHLKEWTLAEHAAYASIRRREEKLF